MKNKLLLIGILIFICNWSGAFAKEYDGVWFLGFNMKKPLFADEHGALVRKAVAMAIDRNKIASKIMGDENVPVGIIPPGMEGYDPSLAPYPHNYGEAKKLMRDAGYTLADPKLKQIAFLITDGLKTKDINDEIKRDLINLGFDITTTTVKYGDFAGWQKELLSGKYDIFLMGYKAGNLGQIFIADKSTGLFHQFTCFKNTTNEADQAYFDRYEDAVKAGFSPDPDCHPQPDKAPTTLELVRPLFYTGEMANVGGFSNKRVDILLEELSTIDEKLVATRKDKFEEIGRIIYEEVPAVPLFYITRL